MFITEESPMQLTTENSVKQSKEGKFLISSEIITMEKSGY